MASPIPYDYRQKIVGMRQAGFSFGAITNEIPYSKSSIKRIWYRYLQEGQEGLRTKYHQSGRQSPYPKSLSDKIALIKDGEQGAPYVRSVLLERYAQEPIPHERTLQRWWKKQGSNLPRGRPRNKPQWAKLASQTWQFDGKGYIGLKNEREVSWMKVADEASGSDLLTRLFPP